MSYPPTDPKGYYRMLGVVPGATVDVIKAAYRRRAKDLHPDKNPRPDARDEFQRLSEAYHTLSDAKARATYDSGRLKSPSADREPYRPVACCTCGKVAAQPRFLIFPTVQGRLFRSVTGSVEGVFCRRCADATALRIALRTWLTGWWSLPAGPFHTVRALVVLLGGGTMPRPANHSLLLRQARAFLLRNGHLYEVTRPALPLRAGAGSEHPVVAELDAGTVVMVSDNAPGGGWVRVFVDEDRTGYVSGRYLTPSLAGRGLDGLMK